MVLEVVDQITLNTRIGTSVIQLLLGDITDLSVDKKVDIVFTSAFPGEYGCGKKATLIYWLKSKLGINVSNLAKDKVWDGRKNFFCWLSEKLPPDKPFRRLACLEVPNTENMQEHISTLFRATMPIFSGKESSIITPLLGTGCQGFSVEVMMKLMVITARYWIKAGLPLTCMKLVLFCTNIEKARTLKYNTAIKKFNFLKADIEKKEKEVENESYEYDVTLCFHEQDKELMHKIKATFLKVDKSLKIHSDIFIKNEMDDCQDETFKVLANSKRIVTVLTLAFVKDEWCLEQFYMAQSCNSLKRDEVLMPFNMETVGTRPSSMNLIQYKDCRVINSGENAEGKLKDACSEVIKGIKNSSVISTQLESSRVIEKEKQAPVYDVFISYSHKTKEFPEIAFNILKEKYPNLNVFFDKEELKTGNTWQQALYDALDFAHCVIAFLSDPYMESSVCQEELNIALARKKAKDNFILVPVCLPGLSEVSGSYEPISPVTIFSSDEIEGLINKIMPSVEKIISGEKVKEELDVTSVRNIQIHNRYQDFKKKFTFDKAMKRLVPLFITNKVAFDMKSTITFFYGSDGMKLAASLSQVIKEEFPDIITKFISCTQMGTRKEFDSAHMVVIFVSDEFLWSQHHVEELHIALCRQRTIKDSTVVYLVEVNHQAPIPFYTHILPYNVSMDDPMWIEHAKSYGVKAQPCVVNTPGVEGTYNCSAAEHLALMKMKIDIMELLCQKGQGSSVPSILVNILKTELLNEGRKDRELPVSGLPRVTGTSVEHFMKLNASEHSAKNYPKESVISAGLENLLQVTITPGVGVTGKKRPTNQLSEACKNELEEPQDQNESKVNQNNVENNVQSEEQISNFEEKMPPYNEEDSRNRSVIVTNQRTEGEELMNADFSSSSSQEKRKPCILS